MVVFVDTQDGILVKASTVVTDENLREEVIAVVRSIRERFAEDSAEEIEALVDEALRESWRRQS